MRLKKEILDMLKKKSTILLLSILFVSVFALVFTFFFTDEGFSRTNSSPEIILFLEDDSTSLTPFRSILGSFEAEGGNGNEIVLITEIDDYAAQRELIEAQGITVADFIDNVLEDGSSFFIDQATELRNEIELDYLRLTIIYMGDGEEITRASFYSR